MSTPPVNPRGTSLQPPSKPPDPHNPLGEAREVLPSSASSSDAELEVLAEEIALAKEVIREKQEKLNTFQKRKRFNPDSNPTSRTAEVAASDSDISSGRPRKSTKLDQGSITMSHSSQGPDSNLDENLSATSRPQAQRQAPLLAPPPPPPLVSSLRRRARVSLDDPASSADPARDFVIAASKWSSETAPNGVSSSDQQKGLWETPTQMLAKGLNMILPEEGSPPRPEGLALWQVKPSGKAKKQGANDEDEEEEVQSELTSHEDPRTHKRNLSVSESESTLRPESQAPKRARMLSKPPVFPSADTPSIPSATSPHPPFMPPARTEERTILPPAPVSNITSMPSPLPPQPNLSHHAMSAERARTIQPGESAPSEITTIVAKQPASANTEPDINGLGRHAPSKYRKGKQHATATEAADDADESSTSSTEESPKPDRQKQQPNNSQVATPEVEESDDPEIYGAHKPAQGKFATRFYPGRAPELKVPTGHLSERRRRMRYAGKTDDEIQKICAADIAAQEVLPKYARAQIKGIKRAYFDSEVHCWLSPRIYNLSLLEDHSAAKNTLQTKVIHEFFERFPDLHPDNLYLRNAAMEGAYIAKIKSSLTSHTSSLKKKATTVTRNPARFRPVLFTSIKKVVTPRAEDIWFEDPLVKASLANWWAEVDAKAAANNPPKVVRKTRLARYVSWRKKVFTRLPPDVRLYYRQLAQDMKGEPEAMEPENLILHGIPFIQSWLHEFSLRTGVPFMLVMSTLNPENPTQIDTYCQTGRGNTPSDIPDFKNMENDWVMKQFIPRWRSFTAKAFAGHDAGAADLTFEVIESALVEDQLEEPAAAEPQQVEGFDDPDQFPSVAKMKEVVTGRIKDSWHRGYASQRINYTKAGAPKYLDPDRRPRVTHTFQVEATAEDGSTVLKDVTSTIILPLINPNDMGNLDLRAWFRHVTNPNVAPANRLAFSGELAKLAAKSRTVPPTIQKAFMLSDDSVDDMDETSSSDEAKPRTNPVARRGKKQVKGKWSSKNAKSNIDEEPEAIESSAPTSDSESPPLNESDDEPTTSQGEHDSDDVPQNRPSKPTTTRSNRLSLPPSHEEKDKTTRSRDAPSTAQRRTSGQSTSAQKKPARATVSSATADCDARKQLPPFIFNGSTAGKDCPQDEHRPPSLERRLEGIRGLPEPDILAACPADCRSLQTLFSSLLHIDHIFPNLPALEVTLLPHGFSKHVGTPQYQNSMTHIFEFVNDIDVPIPQMLELFQNSNRDRELVGSAFDVMTSFIDCTLDKLSSAVMPLRTSNVFGIIARYLDFLRRAETQFKDVRPSPKRINGWLDRLTLAGWRSLVLTYCMSTARGFLKLHYNTGPLDIPPTINLENAVQVVTNWWYLSLRKIAHNPSLEMDMLDFLPMQWRPSLAESPPCIQLSTFNERWYHASFSSTLETEVDRFLEITLGQNLTAFEGISFLDQMQALTSVFATHKHKCETAEAPSEFWLPNLELLVQVMRISCADASMDDAELREIGGSLAYNDDAPPVKPPQRPRPKTKKKGSDRVHMWAIGDVAEIVHNKKRLKVQVIEQDDRLIMINFKTRNILKAKNGIPHAPPDAKDAKIIKIGTEFDRADPDLRRLPSLLPPKPDLNKPETFMYDVVLSDDERAEAAAAAEANRPKPLVVDPALDARPGTDAAPQPRDGNLGTKDQKSNGARKEDDPIEGGSVDAGAKLDANEPSEEGARVVDVVESGKPDEQNSPKPRRQYIKRVNPSQPSSTRATRSQSTTGGGVPGPSTRQRILSGLSPKKPVAGNPKQTANSRPKSVRIQSPAPEPEPEPDRNPNAKGKTKRKGQGGQPNVTPEASTSRPKRRGASAK